jgi:hypothetical protein
MGGILNFITGLVSGIGGLFGGGLSQLLAQLTENVITLGLLLFAIGLGVFAIVYLNRRRQTLDHQRMAAVIKGLHYAGVSSDIFKAASPDARDHFVSGVRWLFGALGLSSAMYGYESIQPSATASAALGGALIGLIPAALGLAHLLCSWLAKRKDAIPSAAVRPGGPAYRAAFRSVAFRSAPRAASRPAGSRLSAYRPAAYRPAASRAAGRRF